jgi:hypothetical protein
MAKAKAKAKAKVKAAVRSGATSLAEPPAIERIEGPRPAGPWGYIVRDGTFAIEIIVTRERFSEWDPRGLRIRDALLHRRVAPRVGVRGEDDPYIEEDCPLAGGPCVSEGVFLSVTELFERHAVKDGNDWQQPEAFWQALEGALRGLRAFVEGD